LRVEALQWRKEMAEVRRGLKEEPCSLQLWGLVGVLWVLGFLSGDVSPSFNTCVGGDGEDGAGRQINGKEKKIKKVFGVK